MVFFCASLALVLALAASVHAESHTVTFQNFCGDGYPVLLAGGKVLANNSDYTSSGPIISAISYLQNGHCLYNGENCLLMELNMNNPTCPGCGPSADLSLIAPHAFSVPTSFQFYGGDGSCDGVGAGCADPSCDTAFFNPNDNQVQRACQADNANILITFCGAVQTQFTTATPGSLSGANAPGGSVDKPTEPAEPATTTAKTTASTTSKAPVNVAPSPSVTASKSPSPSTITCKRQRSSRKRSVDLVAHVRSKVRARVFSH